MRARLLVALLFLLISLPLLFLHADEGTLEGLALRGLLGGNGVHGALTAARSVDSDGAFTTDAHPLDPERRVGRLRLVWPLTEAADLEEHVDALRSALVVREVDTRAEGTVVEAALPGLEGDAVLELHVVADHEAHRIRLEDSGGGSIALDLAGESPAEARMGSRSSLAPPLLAIFLAFLLRSTVPSLFLGVLVGSFLMVPPGEPFPLALVIFARDILWGGILTSWFHLYILGFVLLLSATVAVVTRMGGIEGMVQALVRFAKSSRSVQAVAYGLGLSIFFDDYANTIVVGNSAAPLFDRLKVSREKLAYIVDSTAAPVAGVALLSTWVAYQISTYAPQLPTIGMDTGQGYSLFLETVPFRFYCLLAIVMVGLCIALKRDIGPMVAAERRARARLEDEASASAGRAVQAEIARAPWATPRWFNGVFPIATMILATAWLIYYSGAQGVRDAAGGGDPAAELAIAEGGFLWLRAVLNSANSTWAIFYGSLAALLLAAALAVGQRLLKPPDVARTTGKGLLGLRTAVLILIMAWSIGEVCGSLGTASYLVAVFQDLMTPAFLPVILFLASCFVAFATGSSWATMAIMQPNVVLLADRLGEGTSMGAHGLLVLSIGAVLEGSIFGDHCSPISDTTILSSTASGCVHIEHVRTQAPYALIVAGVAVMFGYLPTSFLGVSPWVSLALGAAALFLILRTFGRDPEQPPARPV